MPHVPHPLLAARSRLREAWACGDGEFQTQRSIDSEWFWLLWHILIIFVCLNWYVRPKDSRDSRDSGKVGRFSDWAFGSESTFKTQGPGNFADIFHPLLDHVNPFTPSGRLWPTTPEKTWKDHVPSKLHRKTRKHQWNMKVVEFQRAGHTTPWAIQYGNLAIAPIYHPVQNRFHSSTCHIYVQCSNQL